MKFHKSGEEVMTPRSFVVNSSQLLRSQFIIKSDKSFLACNGEHFVFWNGCCF